MTTTDYDILIIGGGMAGASLACALGAGALRVGVIEAVAYGAPTQPSYDDRTVSLALGSKRIFETLGVWSGIEARGVNPIRHIHISDAGHAGLARLHSADVGAEALGYVVENRALGAALLERMQALPNLSLICPAQMTQLEPAPDAARVTVVQAGRTRVLGARLLVIADGGRSPARELAGIHARVHDYGQTAIVSNVTPALHHHDTAYERFTSSGPLALLPMRDDRCAVVWSVPPRDVETMLGVSDAEFLARLQTRFGDRLGRFSRVGRRNAYPLALTRVSAHVRARVALVGNAAHTVHPVAAQGFNLGLRDVATLAEVVTDAARAGEDIGALAVLERYARWRRRDNLATTLLTDGLIRAFSNSFAPLALARNLGLIGVDLLPPVKRGLMRRTMGLAGKLPRLARGLPV